VAVGADPRRIAILDNFCWGYTDRPETLGALVRAAIACYDVAIALGTPFISGKDSLNNEFTFESACQRQTIQIPHTLLISALGQVEDVARCVTMDFKSPGNGIYQVGSTKDELAGSHYHQVAGASGGDVPRVDPAIAKRTFAAVHEAINQGLVRTCHDMSEGGLAVAIAEMAFAGGCGAKIDLSGVPLVSPAEPPGEDADVVRLFSESTTRFLIEVAPANEPAVTRLFQRADVPLGKLGEVTPELQLRIGASGRTIIDLPLADLKEAWQRPLRW
jgi:phosphoribosylformylglycinamidine (FGAM) synthase-like enzyme